MTIGSPRARISASLVSVTGRRAAGPSRLGAGRGGHGGTPYGDRKALSIRRTGPTWAATATSARPFRRSTGAKVSGSTTREVLRRDVEGRHRGVRGGGDARAVALAGGDGGGRGLQRAREGERADALLGREADVARGQRQTVVLAHGRHDLEPAGQREVAHHPRHDRRLLGVLLAEDRDVGADGVQQPGDDRAHAGEVGGAAELALEHLGQAADDDPRRVPRRVGLVRRRGEQRVHAEGLEARDVGLLGAGVGREVGRRR